MISQIPSNYASAVTPYAQPGSIPVGQESSELKGSSLQPLEESRASGKNENNRSKDEHPNDIVERERTRTKGGDESAARDSTQAETKAKTQAESAQQEQEQVQIQQLATRDREVRAHERAHASVGGQYAGAPSYSYTRGPDGVSYATSGEVSISTGKISGDPEATIVKARQVRRAAAAPADPSSQDRKVMAQASQMEIQAQVELRQLQSEEARVESDRQKADAVEPATQEKVQTSAADDGQAKDAQKAEEARAKAFAKVSQSNIDISRRLIDIGVVKPSVTSGSLVNQKA